jgi:hypothetical protein
VETTTTRPPTTVQSDCPSLGERRSYAAGEFEGMAAPLAPVAPEWSPIAHFGGYHASATNKGVEQALAVSDVAMAADEVRAWRLRHGAANPTADGAPHAEPC